MKTKTILIAVLIVGLIGVGTMAWASEQKNEPAKQVTADASMDVTPIEVKGMMKQTESGLLLFDGKETYLLKCDKALENLIGKLVTISGDLQKDENGSAIVVKKAMVAN